MGGATDAFISEFNGSLTSLLASTYLGGSGIGDVCYSLAIDSGGNIYATGYTKSSDFPTTAGAYDTSYNDNSGSYDTFIAKLDSTLSATPSDTTAPSGSISINSGASYTNSSTVTLTLSATDATGVTGYYLSDSSSTPSASASGWTSVTSATSYSATVSYSLSSGEGGKTLYAWYKDAAGNVSSTANATITLDTTVPTVTISSPTSGSTYTSTSSTTSLGGSASDSSSGISTVTWSNDRGGNGTATGTASWTVSSISLSSGDNVITVTAKDGANNSGTDTLQVAYSTNTSSTTTSTTTTTTSSTSTTTSSSTTTTTSPTATTTTTTQPTTTSTTTTTQPGSSTTSTTSSTTTTTSSTTTTTLPQPPTPNPTITLQSSPSPAPTLPPLPTLQPSPSPVNKGIVFGFVNDEDEQSLESVTVTIVGANGRSPYQASTETDENGYYEFSGLEAGGYTVTYQKDGYETQTQDISIEEGELKDLDMVTMEQTEKGKIYGYAVNIKGEPIEYVRLKLKGIKTKVTENASTDADGFFEFADLDADTYLMIAKKKGYRKNQQKATLEDGASEEIEIVMKKTSKRIKGLLLEEDIQ